MKVVNNTVVGSRQVGSSRQYVLTVTLSEKEARAIIKGRRQLRKDDIRDSFDNDSYAIDVVNGIVMLAGRVLEDEGRDESGVDFDGRHQD